MSASSGGVCAWGGAETPPQAGSQAAEAAGAAWSLRGGNKISIIELLKEIIIVRLSVMFSECWMNSYPLVN